MESENKKAYRALCKTCGDIPVFSMPWYLDATAGSDNWDVLIYSENGSTLASWTYYLVKNKISLPPLTQTMGIVFYTDKFNCEGKNIFFKKRLITTTLLKALPSVKSFYQSFDWTFTDWLPFYWKGYHQSVRYTYRINDLSNLDNLYKNIKSSVRANIKKATNKYGLKACVIDDIDLFYRIMHKTFERQGIDYKNFNTISAIYNAGVKQDCAKLLAIQDSKGTTYAVSFLVFNKKCAYYISGGADSTLRSTGAQVLLLWESIKYASTRVSEFDFEGSMIQGIENSFNKYGTTQTPYYEIYKGFRITLARVDMPLVKNALHTVKRIIKRQIFIKISNNNSEKESKIVTKDANQSANNIGVSMDKLQDTIKYIVEFLLQDNKDLGKMVYYGNIKDAPNDAKVIIVPSNFFNKDVFLTEQSLPKLPFKMLPNTDIPFLYGTDKIEKTQKCTLLYADIIASSFFMLSRYEEIIKSNCKDVHGRFLGKDAMVFQEGYGTRALVDEWGQYLLSLVKGNTIKNSNDTEEDTKNKYGFSSIYLTHDLDKPYTTFKHVVNETVRAVFHKPHAPHAFRTYLNGMQKDPCYTFDRIIKYDKELKDNLPKDTVKSIYFIISDKGKFSISGVNMYTYANIYSKKYRTLISDLNSSGVKFGLHVSYKGGKDSTRITKEVKRLNTLFNKIQINTLENNSIREREREREQHRA